MTTPSRTPISPTVEQMLAQINGPTIKPEVLLAEFDGLLRNKPTLADIHNGKEEALSWLGGVAAALGHWGSAGRLGLSGIESDIHSQRPERCEPAYRRLLVLLNQGHHSLRMATTGPLNVALQQGKVFEYFDEVRKIIERASADLFFVDAYLDPDFIGRYLPLVPAGVTIRLLGRYKISKLLPAVDMFAAQHAVKIEVRSTDLIHERYVFVDGKECHYSGASFKDGARLTGALLSQIADAFPAMQQTYEGLWTGAKVER